MLITDKRKLLVVEDDPAFGRLLSGVLGQLYDLHLATNGLQAVEITEEWLPEAAIVDIQIPGMCGIELIQRLRRSPWLTNIPIIVLSVLSDYATIMNAISAGSDEYHLKINFSVQTITEAIERLFVVKDEIRKTDFSVP